MHSYFQLISPHERQQVKLLSCDMYEAFRVLKSTYLKQASVCIDPFHVIQLINIMFDKQLKSIMKWHEKGTPQYYLLWNKRILLLSNRNRVNWEKREHNHQIIIKKCSSIPKLGTSAVKSYLCYQLQEKGQHSVEYCPNWLGF